MVQLLANQSSSPAVGDRFPGGENMNLLFISDIVNHLRKNQCGEVEDLFLLFLQFRMLYLLVGGWWWRETEALEVLFKAG